MIPDDPPLGDDDFEQAPIDTISARNIPFLRLKNLFESCLRIKFVFGLNAQSYFGMGGRAIPYVAKAINIVSIPCFDAVFRRLSSTFQFVKQVFSAFGEHWLCIHVIIEHIDLQLLAPHDEFVEEAEDLRYVFVHRQDGYFMTETFFPINKERIVAIAEGIGYAGGAIEALVKKADLVVRHDLICGAVEEHGGSGRQPVFETAVIG